MGPLEKESAKAEKFLELSARRKTLEVTLWTDGVHRARETVRQQVRDYETAQADYERFDRETRAAEQEAEEIRMQAQQLTIAVERLNGDIRSITEQISGSESRIAVLENDILRNEESAASLKEEISAGEQDSTEAQAALQPAQQVRGSLRIALADSVCSTFLPGLLKRYHALCPQVELVLCTATADGMLQMLGTNQIDLAYTLDQPLLQPNLVLAADVPEPVCFIAPSAHPLAGQEVVTLEELPRQEFLLTERGMSYRDALDQCLAARGLAIHPYLELGSAALLCQMVEQGMGLSFLPEYIVRPALAAGRLARLNVPDCTVEMHRQLFYHRDKWLTPQMKAFIELVRQPAPGTASK